MRRINMLFVFMTVFGVFSFATDAYAADVVDPGRAVPAVAEPPSDSGGANTLSEGDAEPVDIDLPESGSQAAELTTDVGALTLDLPAFGSDLAPSNADTAVFDGDAPETTIEVQRSAGLRALIEIGSAAAPERFDFVVGGDVAVLRPRVDGGVDALDSAGEIIASAPAPWARDAVGNPVATHYETNGLVLTQVVEHQNDSGRSYPIVADPCFSCLVSSAWKVTKCASAIAVAVGGVAVPLSKVAKVKRLVKEVGGARKLAKRIIKVAKGNGELSRRIRAVFADLGTSVVGLAAEVLGIQAIADNCF